MLLSEETAGDRRVVFDKGLDSIYWDWDERIACPSIWVKPTSFILHSTRNQSVQLMHDDVLWAATLLSQLNS